jgi:uncharacterized metal-binding protein
MPSGKAHDRITWVTAALATPIWYFASPVRDVAAFAAGMIGYLFSGLYLSSDLDTRSGPLKRWGPLRFLWYPYQRLVPHRSWLSHGLGIGPIARAIYFVAMVWLLARGALWLIDKWLLPVDRNAILARGALALATFVWRHPVWAEWTVGGLVLGGVAHSLADAIVSGTKKTWKRIW